MKRQQSNATLYTLIVFVCLFIAATAVAVIFYTKSEEHRTSELEAKARLEDMADDNQIRNIGKIVGTKTNRETYLGKMAEYLDEAITLINGGIPEEKAGEAAIDTARKKVDFIQSMTSRTLSTIPDKFKGASFDPNTTGLTDLIERLNNYLQTTSESLQDRNQQLAALHEKFDGAMQESRQTEQELIKEKDKYKQQVQEIKKDYEELKALLEQTTDEQVAILKNKYDREKMRAQQLNKELMKTEARFKLSQEKLESTLAKLRAIKPAPDNEAAAFQPDGEVVLIDNQAEIVHINLGTKDKVYRGLTFSVYEKNMPIPKDGKGKAEIEVFDVQDNISAARIIRSEIKRPIVNEDIIANLIWDSKQQNKFVVAGDFDLNHDDSTDDNARIKIENLIKKWGGSVSGMASVETDYVVLGTPPEVRKKPTFDEMAVDPMAMEKYRKSQERYNFYQKVKERAESLYIPVFNYSRFLYFTGYKEQSKRSGAF